MQTVASILDSVYGGKEAAAPALGVGKTAPYNWLSWGHFPARVAIKISHDAESKGIELPLAEIPVQAPKATSAA